LVENEEIQVASGHRQVAGLLPLIAVVVIAALAGIGFYGRIGVLLVLGAYVLLLMGMLLGVRRSLTLRLRQGSSAEEQPRKPISLALVRMVVGILVVNAAGALILWPLSAPTVSSGIVFMAVGLCLLVSFGGIALSQYFNATDKKSLPDTCGLANAFRMLFWISFISAIFLLLRTIGRPVWESELLCVMAGVTLVAGAEMMVRGVVDLVVRRGLAEGPLCFGADLLFTRLLASSFNPLSSVFLAMESTFDIDLQSTWTLAFLRRALFPIAVLLVVIGWLMTAFVAVAPNEQAVLERFGQPLEKPLQPGLHLVWPWPVDRAWRVNVTRVREIPIGYLEAKKTASILWTKYHAAEEFNLLLGDGRDLLTVNADLQYCVGDPYAYLYGTQNPELALEIIAYEVLMGLTVNKSLDDVFSENLETLSVDIAQQIQEHADIRGLGLQVVAFNVRGLHPPVAVADDYQAVVSAQIDKITFVIQAQAYQKQSLPKAKAEKVRIVNQAQSEAATRLGEATGESIAFEALKQSYAVSPSLFRFRRRMETLEEAFQEGAYYIIDDRIERDGGHLWIIE
jgi:regulator of protease activity HflC (stomatin/prohibitin superfamily)